MGGGGGVMMGRTMVAVGGDREGRGCAGWRRCACARPLGAPPPPIDELIGAAEGWESGQVTSGGAEPMRGGGEGRECESMNEKCRASLPPAQRLRAAAGSR